MGVQDLPGRGIGSGSDAGSVLRTGRFGFGLAEWGWPRIMLECGPLPALIFLGFKFGLCIYILLVTWHSGCGAATISAIAGSRFRRCRSMFVFSVPEKMRYGGFVDPRVRSRRPDQRVERISRLLPVRQGMQPGLDGHNSYSTLEALKIIANRMAAKSPFRIFSAFFARELFVRRYHQKELFYRLPCRPVAKFLLMYICKGGFLDGGPGFTYAALQSFSE